MIAAVSWVPKGVAKMVPEVAEPPSKEEIEELLHTGALDAPYVQLLDLILYLYIHPIV